MVCLWKAGKVLLAYFGQFGRQGIGLFIMKNVFCKQMFYV